MGVKEVYGVVNLQPITREWGATAALVYYTLWGLSNEGRKKIRLGVRQIAKEAALSPNTTQRAINILAAGNYILVNRGAWQGGTIAPNEITVNPLGSGKQTTVRAI